MKVDGPLNRERFHVTMADVDAAGILYFGSPLRWYERLMSGWLRRVGLSISEQLSSGHAVPTVRTEVDYRRPLRLDDPVEGELFHVGHGRSSYTLMGRFRHAESEETAVELRHTSVWVSRRLEDGGAAMHASELPGKLLRAFSESGPEPSRAAGDGLDAGGDEAR